MGARCRRPKLSRRLRHRLEFLVINQRIPCGAAAAKLPPFTAPGLGGHLHGWMLERFARIPGNQVKAPGDLAGIGIVSRDVTTTVAALGAALADVNLAGSGSRRTGNIEAAQPGWVPGVDVPIFLTGCGIDCDQSAIERTDVDATFVDRDSAIVCRPAASQAHETSIAFRIERPDLFLTAIVSVDVDTGRQNCSPSCRRARSGSTSSAALYRHRPKRWRSKTDRRRHPEIE